MFVLKAISLLVFIISLWSVSTALYPRESETRDLKLLDGFWNFRVITVDEDQNIGFTDKWYTKPLVRHANTFTFYRIHIYSNIIYNDTVLLFLIIYNNHIT